MPDSDLLYLSPYGAAMDLVGRVVQFDGDEGQISTEYVYASDAPMIVAHTQAAGPVVPGVFLIEQAAQSALALLRLSEDVVDWTPRLVNTRAEWHLPVPLGLPIRVDVRAKPVGARMYSFVARFEQALGCAAIVRGVVALVKDHEPES
ncbi:hypothetical protein [Pontivivens ytuae]|uniref:Uncharacterized protein n=1 Tax=Pontivivens ytuae TaxID=2789856 RepID=A0A7S9QF12_9RHOB|nr:hypothetical protein [Pontivivens ytuae]QPH56032.1 hypothetical protein I0K15_10045 [Pontivivens ytuae]